MRETLLEMVAPVIGEDVVEVQSFYPGGRWKRGSMSWMRLGRQVIGKGRLDDKLPTLNVLAVTPTRVVVYPTSTRTGAFTLGDEFGAWPRDSVRASAKSVEMTITPDIEAVSAGERSHSNKVLRMTLSTPDGELVADLPASEHATRHIEMELDAG